MAKVPLVSNMSFPSANYKTSNGTSFTKYKDYSCLSISCDDLFAYGDYKKLCIAQKKPFLKPLEWLKQQSKPTEDDALTKEQSFRDGKIEKKNTSATSIQ